MNFLIAEIMGSVALAIVFGAAVGWLIHRLIANRTTNKLRSYVLQLQGEARESREESTMLAEDYEELRQRSTVEIDRLSRDNLQMPVLQQNLEKSQLLVRQMMKRHEAALRDLKTENDVLRQRINTLNTREHARNKSAPQTELTGDSPSPETTGRAAAANPTTVTAAKSVAPVAGAISDAKASDTPR